jgi:hypothetical protein
MAFKKFEIDSGAAKSDRKQVSGDKKLQVHDNQSDFVLADATQECRAVSFLPEVACTRARPRPGPQPRRQ